MLSGLVERNGEYGKVIRLSDEIIANVDNERKQGGGISGISEQVALRAKSRALTFKGDCEYHLEHPDEAERYYLESINLMMDGVTQSDDYWVIDGMFTAILETTEFYLEQGKAEKALSSSVCSSSISYGVLINITRHSLRRTADCWLI